MPNRPAADRLFSVLVVDDGADAGDSLAALLSLHGFTVRTAPDGPSALKDAAAVPPDVVLFDIAMPGMTGWELARRLRARSAGRPPYLIAVTGYGRDADRRASDEAGIDLHPVKPVDPAQLLTILNQLRASPARPVSGVERVSRGARRPGGARCVRRFVRQAAEIQRRVAAARLRREALADQLAVIREKRDTIDCRVTATVAGVRAGRGGPGLLPACGSRAVAVTPPRAGRV